MNIKIISATDPSILETSLQQFLNTIDEDKFNIELQYQTSYTKINNMYKLNYSVLVIIREGNCNEKK